MEQKTTEKLPLRLLLNAEPFGFGPTAAIASFFPHLKGHVDAIGYVGKKHTLDLQRALPYDVIHDVTPMAKEERAETLAPIFKNYDVFVTAMDHKMAEYAQDSGLKVIFYDALTWYWKDFPASVQKADLYLAQNFFGVSDRLAKDFSTHPHAYAIPPIIPKINNKTPKDTVLINLGGLQNPFWPLENIVSYADHVTDALLKAIPDTENVILAASKSIAERLQHKNVKTYQRDDMKTILARSKIAFMTPGLGNIYDAAAYNVPTVWLPPANDSQGQQLTILQQKRMADAVLNWDDIVNIEPIDYQNEQISVLNLIADTSRILSHDTQAQENLAKLAVKTYNAIAGKSFSSTNHLITCFGTGGEEIACGHILRQCSDYARQKDLRHE